MSDQVGREPQQLGLTVHVENQGDIEAAAGNWAGDPSGPNRIEGFSISDPLDVWNDHVTYHTVMTDGTIGPDVPAGEFCGTRGRRLPIHGFIINTSSAASSGLTIAYEGAFQDGYRSGTLCSGELCVSPKGAALVAMRVSLPPATSKITDLISEPAAIEPAPLYPVPLQLGDPNSFLSPRDLQVSLDKPLRILGIGSCFLTDLMAASEGEESLLRGDFLRVNHGPDLTESPPSHISSYDYQLIQIPLRAILPDQMFSYLALDDLVGHERAFNRARKNLDQHLRERMRWNILHGCPTFVMNFMQPQFNPHGRFHRRFDLRNPEYFVSKLNQELEEMASTYQNTYILDIDRVAASFGRRYTQDDVFTGSNHNAKLPQYYVTENRIEPLGCVGDYYDVMPDKPFRLALEAELLAMHRTIWQIDSVKLVIFDLDDTLWNGVSGEKSDVGPDMIEGWPIGIVEALHYIRKRGILLAIASKNDETRIREAWDIIFHGRLSLEDFAAVRINWQSKDDNVRELLAATKILPRNAVFVDDNPAERARVEQACPGIRTLGRNPYLIRRILLLAPELQVARVTAESSQRTAMMQAQILREKERGAQSAEEFFQSLQVRVRLGTIRDTRHPRFPRALELLNKTNQFNTTGKQWSAIECQAFFDAGGVFRFYAAQDRFTAYGLVGVIAVHSETILQWVMSCRVIGLNIEAAVMSHLVAVMRAEKGACEISGMFVETGRNQPCRRLFPEAGFISVEGVWKLPAASVPGRVPHVSLEDGKSGS